MTTTDVPRTSDGKLIKNATRVALDHAGKLAVKTGMSTATRALRLADYERVCPQLDVIVNRLAQVIAAEGKMIAVSIPGSQAVDLQRVCNQVARDILGAARATSAMRMTMHDLLDKLKGTRSIDQTRSATTPGMYTAARSTGIAVGHLAETFRGRVPAADHAAIIGLDRDLLSEVEQATTNMANLIGARVDQLWSRPPADATALVSAQQSLTMARRRLHVVQATLTP